MKNMKDEQVFSSVNLGECENILRAYYNIDENDPLIFLKYTKVSDENENNYESTFQYEIFHPRTFQKLNLSLCDNTTIDVYVPMALNEEQEEIYNDLVEQGYDPFDLNDKFYREICTPYTSENGTDVLLDDREEFVYSSLVNKSLCPTGCGYSEYSLDNKYIKCECDANNTDIVTLDLEHISGKNAYQSLLSTLKTSNYKVMRCYNLVFNFKIFCHNYGSQISLAFFVAYLGFMIYYSCKELSPLKLAISKILFQEKGDEDMPKIDIKKPRKSKNVNKIKIEDVPKTSGNNPPKRGIVRKSTVLHTEDDQIINTDHYEFFENKKSGRRKSRTKTKTRTKRTTIESSENVLKGEKSSEVTTIKKNKNADVVNYETDKTHKEKFNEKYDRHKKEKREHQENNIIYDDYELNNMDYQEASKNDKRSCLRTYWSMLMRENSFLFTFFACYDYNLFYIKIERFFILLCTEMTMNGLFFVHESMHRKYTEGENFTFVQKLPQLIFTIIVADLIDVLLCFFCMTDKHIYDIKELARQQKEKNKKEKNEKVKNGNNDRKEFGQKIMDILDCMQRKMVWFFVFTFLLFLFYWYFISAFCAVYQNTQVIFLRDSGISFITSLVETFFIYGFTNILRAISLCACCRKKLGCVYKISDLIPIF